MASDMPPVVFDDDNPEWTDADFARARPIADFPELAAAFPGGAKPRGRPKGSTTSNKEQVTLRIDKDVLERFRADGEGWQTRLNESLHRRVSAAPFGDKFVVAATRPGEGRGVGRLTEILPKTYATRVEAENAAKEFASSRSAEGWRFIRTAGSREGDEAGPYSPSSS